MQIMGRPRTEEKTGSEPDDVWIVVESDEHEMLEFHAGSEDELEAKLDDFRTWAG